MSQQKSPIVPQQQQAHVPSKPAAPSAPLPLDQNLLGLVSGGVATTCYPGTNW